MRIEHGIKRDDVTDAAATLMRVLRIARRRTLDANTIDGVDGFEVSEAIRHLVAALDVIEPLTDALGDK